MVVKAHAWLKKGDVSSQRDGASFDTPKSELAKEANISTQTIDQAEQVSLLGRSEEEISGEKSASAVVEEERTNGTCLLPLI